MADIQEAIDSILARETTGVTDLNTARDAAIKAITDAYTEGMSYYKDLDISPEAWTRLSAAPIRKTIDTLYSNIVEGNQRSRGTMAVRPVVDEAFSATVPLAAQSVKDASTYGTNLAAKRADLLGQKGSGIASAELANQTAIGNLRANTTSQITTLKSDQAKMDWQGTEAEKNRALERIKYASTTTPDSTRSLYSSAGLGSPNLSTVYGESEKADPGSLEGGSYTGSLEDLRKAQYLYTSFSDPWNKQYDYQAAGAAKGVINDLSKRIQSLSSGVRRRF